MAVDYRASVMSQSDALKARVYESDRALSVTAEAGALQGDVDAAARARGRELTVLTTTYAAATAAGWVAGGHVGLGAGIYGTIWDGNVLSLELLTAEDPPRSIRLEGDDLYPALHTYGTVGVITQVTFPTVTARDWRELVVAFDAFESAARYTMALAGEPSVVQRVACAEEAPMPCGFKPLRAHFGGAWRVGRATHHAASAVSPAEVGGSSRAGEGCGRRRA